MNNAPRIDHAADRPRPGRLPGRAPPVWVCGLPGGAFAGVVGRIDGDAVEIRAIAGGRRWHSLMPSGWNSNARKAPVRTRAIREAYRFGEAGFRV